MKNKKIFDEIFENRLLSISYKDLAEAIILGDKCADLPTEKIKETTDLIIKTMVAYYGQRLTAEAVNDLHKAFPIELKKYHPQLTIQEIKLGVGMAMRDKFGEPKYQKLSIKLLSELVNRYQLSDVRKNIYTKYQKVKEELTATHRFHSEEEIQEILSTSIIYKFEKFKEHGLPGIIISHIDYDYLTNVCAVPDFKEFLLEAAKKFKHSPNQTNISAAIEKQFTANIAGEAKKQALIKLFTDLIQKNIHLKAYINDKTV